MSAVDFEERLKSLSSEKREQLFKKLKEKEVMKDSISIEELNIKGERKNINDPFPLYGIQQVYWMGETGVYDNGNTTSNIYIEFEVTNINNITAKLFHKRINYSINRLVDHYDMLRAVLLPNTFQKILDKTPKYNVKIIDLRKYNKEESEKILEDMRISMRYEKTVINQWPLFKFVGHRLKDNRIVIHVKLCALLMDGTTMIKFMTQLSKMLENPNIELENLEFSYRDYVMAESIIKNSNDYIKSKRYWLNKIHDIAPGPILPLKIPDLPSNQQRFTVEEYDLMTAQEWKIINENTIKNGLSVFSVLLTAYIDVIAYWSFVSKFSIGVVNTFRPNVNAEMKKIMGNFNTMDIVTLDVLDSNFTERTKKIESQIISNAENAYFSGFEILRELNKKNRNYSSITMPVYFNSTINLDNEDVHFNRNQQEKGITSTEEDLISSIKKKIINIIGPKANLNEVNIYLSFLYILPTLYIGDDGQIICKWGKKPDIFQEGTVNKIFEAYKKHLNSLIYDKKSWNNDWTSSTVSFQDRQWQLQTNEKSNIDENNLYDIFLKIVFMSPQKVALRNSNIDISYEKLYKLSNRVSDKLSKLGVGKDSVVLLDIDRGWEQIVAVLSIFRLGASYIPLNMDLELYEIGSVIRKNNIEYVLTKSELQKNSRAYDIHNYFYIDKECEFDKDEDIKDEENRNYDNNNSRCILYYKNNEGILCKKVIDNKIILKSIMEMNSEFKVNNLDKIISLYDINSDYWLYDIFSMLLVGGTIVIPKNEFSSDESYLGQVLQKEKITIWNYTENMLDRALDNCTNEKVSLRLIIINNERINMRFVKKVSNLNENIAIRQVWGIDDTFMWAMLRSEVDDYKLDFRMKFNKLLNDNKVYVLNKGLEECPLWALGNIFISSVNKEKDLRKTKYIGRYNADGYIEILGLENDFEIYLMKNNINLGMIEAQIEGYEGVEKAKVAINKSYNGDKSLTAHIVAKEKSSEYIENLKEYLYKKLPYYAVPEKVISVDCFEVNNNAENNTNIFNTYLFENVETCNNYTENESNIINKLINIWRTILGVDEIDINDNFFVIGGDSLKAVKVILKMREEFGLSIAPEIFFKNPTIIKIYEKIGDKII